MKGLTFFWVCHFPGSPLEGKDSFTVFSLAKSGASSRKRRVGRLSTVGALSGGVQKIVIFQAHWRLVVETPI